jgi:hypothetical protein
VDVVSKGRSKTHYFCHGATCLHKALLRHYRQGPLINKTEEGADEQTSINRGIEHPASLHEHKHQPQLQLGQPSEGEECEERKIGSTCDSVPKQSSERIDLRGLSAKVIRVFLHSNRGQPQSLESIALQVVGEKEYRKRMTTQRRLYDIVNILSSLNLIEKCQQKPAYRWKYPLFSCHTPAGVSLPPGKHRFGSLNGVDSASITLSAHVQDPAAAPEELERKGDAVAAKELKRGRPISEYAQRQNGCPENLVALALVPAEPLNSGKRKQQDSEGCKKKTKMVDTKVTFDEVNVQAASSVSDPAHIPSMVGPMDRATATRLPDTGPKSMQKVNNL